MKRRTSAVARALIAMLLCLLSLPTAAQVRAWLDRDRIALGETATLNIESVGTGSPDYAPLLADFDLSGHVSRQTFEIRNGTAQARSVHGVVLRPRGTGTLRIPALRVGAARTAPLLLVVGAPVQSAPPAAAGRDVFIESLADAADPYVQQSVGWTVRLYALPALVSGRLDQDAPDGASLQRIGDDVQYRRDIGGRTYQVIERRYLLIPERSGPLAMPPARFEGRAVGNVFDRLFGDGQIALRAQAPPRVLRIRAIPANASTPWLPLHAVAMEFLERPARARVGESATLAVQVLADGASRAQMPELEIPVPEGAQVYAERAQVDEAIVAGRPRVRITRRYSIVPDREGPLRIEGPRVDWWDVRAAQPRTTRLPPIELDVAPGAAAPTRGPSLRDELPHTAVGADAGPRPWRHPALLAALAVLAAALAWASRRPAARPQLPEAASTADTGPSLARALQMGDLPDIEAALRAAAPQARDLDAIAAELADADQRAAVLALRDARWGRGDPATARERLRGAFAGPPAWRATPRPARAPLPPLYPSG